MFSLLDRLEGWQLLLVLAPLVLIMTLIKKAALNQLQKAWVFTTLLAPGLGAKLLTLLSVEERERVLNAGGNLTGSPRKVALPVLELFFKSTDFKSPPGKDVDEICRWLNLKFEPEPEQLVALYRKAYL